MVRERGIKQMCIRDRSCTVQEVAVLLALPETVKSLMKQSVWPLESVSTLSLIHI